ncbi:MAG: hypothetical protein IKC47_03385 [Clostridia bacterium]|nr:hypothetical protein [Clostridia bacterium]
MQGFDVYVFILCLIVFVLLTAVLGWGIAHIAKLSLRLIKTGAEDEKIKTEYEKFRKKSGNKTLSIVDRVVSVALFAVVLCAFCFALVSNVNGKDKVGSTPVLQVVQSGSMSYKHEKNKHVFGKDSVDNQLQVFDLILVHKLPAEEDLQLYDVVVYEVGEILVIHRIVGIEEPNENHSERYFLLQGDAVENPDRFPVRYSQMKGIYQNQRVPFVGSLIMFLQSPAGYLCVLLIAVALFVAPAVDKKLWNAKMERLATIATSPNATEQDKQLAAELVQKVRLKVDKIPTQRATAYKPVARVNLDGNALNVHVKFVSEEQLAANGQDSNLTLSDKSKENKIIVSVKGKK